MIPTKFVRVLVGLFLLSPSSVLAYSFELTETEFRTWPAYCKVVYVRTTIGKRTTFAGLISPDDYIAGNAVLASHKSPYGDGGVHHMCAGMKWLERSRIEQDPQKRGVYLNRAVSETRYTLERAETGGFVFVLASTQMAAALHEQGEDSKALALLERTISVSPSDPKPYLMKALIHHKRREYEVARDVLIEGNRNVAGASPDIHYNLGLVMLKLEDYEGAAEHAYLAYSGGYPLPGLRRQLERLGRWNPPQ